MEINSLIFQTVPQVTLATNTFINVPVILRYEDINLIELVREANLGITTQIPIFHPDGTHLAKVNGTRLYLTEQGKKAGLKIEKHSRLWVCKMQNQTLFEIHQQSGDAFKTIAELYTPDGYFVKCLDTRPGLIDASGNALKIGGVIMSNTTFVNRRVGVWIHKDGSCSIG